jgi:SNF2 family DNA or RNA helicase
MLAAATNPGLLVTRGFREIEMGFSWPPREIALDSRLRQLVEDYLNFEVPWKFRHVAAQVEANAKLGRKTLIWTSFVGNIAAVKRLLTKFNPAVVYGAVEASERDSEISRFRMSSDCAVLITNPQTLGEGISLHMECHDAIYLDRTYNAGLYLQSLDRIHRLGLPHEVETRIQILVSRDTIDERVSRRLEQKIKKLSSFLEDPGLLGASIPSSDELSPEDVFGISEADLRDVYSYMVTPDRHEL